MGAKKPIHSWSPSPEFLMQLQCEASAREVCYPLRRGRAGIGVPPKLCLCATWRKFEGEAEFEIRYVGSFISYLVRFSCSPTCTD